jgi:hypothetical protein
MDSQDLPGCWSVASGPSRHSQQIRIGTFLGRKSAMFRGGGGEGRSLACSSLVNLDKLCPSVSCVRPVEASNFFPVMTAGRMGEIPKAFGRNPGPVRLSYNRMRGVAGGRPFRPSGPNARRRSWSLSVWSPGRRNRRP